MSNSTSESEPGLDVSTNFIGDSSTLAAEWSQLVTTTYIDTWRLESDDQCFVPAPICNSVVQEGDGNSLVIQYYQRDKVFPTMSVVVFVAQYPDRLDAQRFRFGS